VIERHDRKLSTWNRKLFAIYQQILLEARIHTRSIKRARKEYPGPRTCIRVGLRYGTAGSASERTWASPIDAGLCLHEHAICSAISFPDAIARWDHRLQEASKGTHTVVIRIPLNVSAAQIWILKSIRFAQVSRRYAALDGLLRDIIICHRIRTELRIADKDTNEQT